MKNNSFYFLAIIYIYSFQLFSQNVNVEGVYDDPSINTQYAFVEELLYIAGYVPEKILVYQTLPNYAHVFRIKLDSVNGGFMFVRWDKMKREHYLSNKMIDPGFYYNLNVARELMRKQTEKANFNPDDIGIQPKDQVQISDSEIKEIREEFDLIEKENQIKEDERIKVDFQKNQRKRERKSSKRKN